MHEFDKTDRPIITSTTESTKYEGIYEGIPGEVRLSVKPVTQKATIPGEAQVTKKPSTKRPVITPGLIPGEGQHILKGDIIEELKFNFYINDRSLST